MEVKAEDSEMPLIKLLFICELLEVFSPSRYNCCMIPRKHTRHLVFRTGCIAARSSEGLDTRHGHP